MLSDFSCGHAKLRGDPSLWCPVSGGDGTNQRERLLRIGNKAVAATKWNPLKVILLLRIWKTKPISVRGLVRSDETGERALEACCGCGR